MVLSLLDLAPEAVNRVANLGASRLLCALGLTQDDIAAVVGAGSVVSSYRSGSAIIG